MELPALGAKITRKFTQFFSMRWTFSLLDEVFFEIRVFYVGILNTYILTSVFCPVLKLYIVNCVQTKYSEQKEILQATSLTVYIIFHLFYIPDNVTILLILVLNLSLTVTVYIVDKHNLGGSLIQNPSWPYKFLLNQHKN